MRSRPTKTIDLKEQEFEDLLSACSFTLREYPAKGAAEFKDQLKKLFHKLWRTHTGLSHPDEKKNRNEDAK